MNDRRAATFRYVYEGGKHYVIISFGLDKDDWIRCEINDAQVGSFINDSLLRVLRR